MRVRLASLCSLLLVLACSGKKGARFADDSGDDAQAGDDPETNLVVIRKPIQPDVFADVTLDCAGKLGNWQTVGPYQWTRVDLSTGDFQNVGMCSNGRHEMTSQGAFGLTVWGWGRLRPRRSPPTCPTRIRRG